MSRKKEYVLLVILGVIFLAAGGYLFQVWEDYHEASAGYQKLQKFIIEKPDVGRDSKGKSKNQEDPEENLPEIDFDGLRAINGDIVAWIQIPGINVDYPVVQGKDNEHYLHYTFDGKANKAGSIFLDYRNRADFMDSKVILYGHNMKDGSMFSNLKKFQDAGFRKEQGRVLIYLPEKTLTYEVIECRGVTERDGVYEMDNKEKEKQMILSTCSSSANIRMIVKCTMDGKQEH
ncbi:SrtB family sortase [Schaedlerella arabinosiphila]|uniref:SrtB family sortase n=1 Tax=Schaedlerella arabinosiphila TaxID=2044587 RepID=A0A3R8JN22_9FIRM|nr:class B sortase [Schaedlerella arabinosiphila]EOS40231.1 SrtB family sortase [Lachnospiraceae bacterium M18-1]RRK32113.1 SrtB family sortase [Schaedlerella arabinosiphila]